MPGPSRVATDADVRARLWRRIAVDELTGCWVWTGAKTPTGYGYIGLLGYKPGRRMFSVHRTAYEAYVGPIPDGLQIDHLCRNRGCCNPEHLEAVTLRENTLRGTAPSARHAIKTHCPKGHEYSPENTAVRDGSRHCRTCHRAREAKRRAARKAATAPRPA